MRLSPSRSLITVVPLVMVAFIGAHVLLVRTMEHLEADAAVIGEASDQVQSLSQVRGYLQRLGMSSGHALMEQNAGGTVDDEEIRRWTALVQSSMKRLPAGEMELQAKLDAALATIQETEQLRKTGDLAGARALESMSAVRATDASLEEAINQATERGQAAATEVASLNTQLKRTTPTLDAIAAVFALILTFIAWRIVRDQMRVMEERDQLAVQQVEELNLFAGRVAHDLRNPLSALMMRVSVLQRHFAAHTFRDDLARLGSIAGRMNQMIDGLLTFARAGGRPEKETAGEVKAVLEGVVEDLSAEARASGARLDIEPVPAVLVACPPGPLASILGNLIRNAVKYIVEAPGPEKVITVRVDEAPDHVRVFVEDTGPGIPPGGELSIFEPFVRGATQVPGVGLGLATVKRLVEAYGGTVGVEPLPVGSRFWFELPRLIEAGGAVPAVG